MDDYRLPDNEIFVLKRFHKTLKVKREADKVKAVYLLGSKKRYKVHYSPSGVKKLLHRLNFSYKKPKVVPGKFDNHLQGLFLRKYRRILKTRGKNDVASTIRLLTKLERLYPLAAKIHVILDNATYYHSSEVMAWLARHKKFKLHFLLPYSPNLNLIERLWKFFNEKVRNNRYYASFKQFTQACRSFFRCRKKWTVELRSRITQNFQRFKNQCFK